MRALTLGQQSKDLCPSSTACSSPSGVEDASTARTNARIADVLVGAGLAGVATALVVYLTLPRPSSSGLTVAPMGVGGAGLSATGKF